MRPYVKVMWDIRSVAEWVIEFRVIHESRAQEQIDMLYARGLMMKLIDATAVFSGPHQKLNADCQDCASQCSAK